MDPEIIGNHHKDRSHGRRRIRLLTVVAVIGSLMMLWFQPKTVRSLSTVRRTTTGREIVNISPPHDSAEYEMLCTQTPTVMDVVFSVGGTDYLDRLDELEHQLKAMTHTVQTTRLRFHVHVILEPQVATSLEHEILTKPRNHHNSSFSSPNVTWYEIDTATEERMWHVWNTTTNVEPVAVNAGGRLYRLFLQDILTASITQVLYLDTWVMVTDWNHVYQTSVCQMNSFHWISVPTESYSLEQILGFNLQAIRKQGSILPAATLSSTPIYDSKCAMFPDLDLFSSLRVSLDTQGRLHATTFSESSVSSLRSNAKSVIIMSDTRPRSAVNTMKYTYHINREYARLQKYSFHLYNPTRCQDDFSCLPPSKLLAVQDFVTCPVFQTVLFLDSDAMFRDWKLSIVDFLQMHHVNDYSVVFPTDCIPKSYHNSGIQIWNTHNKTSRPLLQEWIDRVRNSDRYRNRHPFEQKALDDWYMEPNSSLALVEIPSGPDTWNYGACALEYKFARWISHISGGWGRQRMALLEAEAKRLNITETK